MLSRYVKTKNIKINVSNREKKYVEIEGLFDLFSFDYLIFFISTKVKIYFSQSKKKRIIKLSLNPLWIDCKSKSSDYNSGSCLRDRFFFSAKGSSLASLERWDKNVKEQRCMKKGFFMKQ